MPIALSALVMPAHASVTALVCSVYAVGYLREDERTGALDDRRPPAIAQILHPDPAIRRSPCCWSRWPTTWASCGRPSKLTTLASVFLVTFYGKVTSLEAAWKYAIIGGVGLSMALFGTVLVTYYAGHKLAGVRRS